MEKLLLNIEPAMKAQLYAVAESRNESMAAVVREALYEFMAEPAHHDPPYTLCAEIPGTPSVEDLHMLVDVVMHYAAKRLGGDPTFGGVSRDGFKIDLGSSEDVAVVAHHLFCVLLRTEYDYAHPWPIGLVRSLKVRAIRDVVHVEFSDVLYNPSMARRPETEFGAGAALILLAVPDKWRDGRECAALVLGAPTDVKVNYTLEPLGTRAMAYCNLSVDFQTGALIRVHDGESLGAAVAAFKPKGLAQPVGEIVLADE